MSSQVFCIKDGEKQEDPSACPADDMPLSDEPCEAPCPAMNETVEGSGNGTTNATDTEEPAEEGKYLTNIKKNGIESMNS